MSYLAVKLSRSSAVILTVCEIHFDSIISKYSGQHYNRQNDTLQESYVPLVEILDQKSECSSGLILTEQIKRIFIGDVNTCTPSV
jgi:hypothetical protein